jgi:hypothetical protein
MWGIEQTYYDPGVGKLMQVTDKEVCVILSAVLAILAVR